MEAELRPKVVVAIVLWHDAAKIHGEYDEEDADTEVPGCFLISPGVIVKEDYKNADPTKRGIWLAEDVTVYDPTEEISLYRDVTFIPAGMVLQVIRTTLVPTQRGLRYKRA